MENPKEKKTEHEVEIRRLGLGICWDDTRIQGSGARQVYHEPPVEGPGLRVDLLVLGLNKVWWYTIL